MSLIRGRASCAGLVVQTTLRLFGREKGFDRKHCLHLHPSAMARVEDRLKALTAGYQNHVSKPVEPSELVTIVSSLVGLIHRG